MSWLQRFVQSSVGSKILMALTGLVLSLFVAVHMAGNLLVYVGQRAMNDYAEFLQSKPVMVWTFRLVMLVVLGLHVLTGVRLYLANRRARPVSYVKEATLEASFASRTMVLSGLVILFYLVYHILHFTAGVIDTAAYDLHESIIRNGELVQRHDAYGMVIQGFQNNVAVVIYVIANLLLTLHLSHGVASLFQTLGIHNARYTPVIEKLGILFAAVVGAGFVSIPLAVRLGLVS